MIHNVLEWFLETVSHIAPLGTSGQHGDDRRGKMVQVVPGCTECRKGIAVLFQNGQKLGFRAVVVGCAR